MSMLIRGFVLLLVCMLPSLALAEIGNVELHHVITFLVIVFAFGLGFVVFSERHHVIGLHFLVWTLVCYLSAIPSFLLGIIAFDKPHEVIAMLLGILVFVVAYTMVSSSAWFARLQQIPQLYTAFKAGFVLRIIASIVYPLGQASDIYLGVLALGIVDYVWDTDAERWATLAIFLATLVQGVLLNIVLSMIIGFIFVVLRLWMFLSKNRKHSR